jgi:hypothetical protein
LPKFLTIQKPDRHFTPTGFAAALKPNVFDGDNYKRWRAKMVLWLTAMNVFHVTKGKPEKYTPEEEATFEAADNLFRGAVISVLSDGLVDVYLSLPSGKAVWDALEEKFGVSDAGCELYVMETLFSYEIERKAFCS